MNILQFSRVRLCSHIWFNVSLLNRPHLECVVDGASDLLLGLHGALTLHLAPKRHQVGSGFSVVGRHQPTSALHMVHRGAPSSTHSPGDGQRQLDDDFGLDLDGDQVFLFTCSVAQERCIDMLVWDRWIFMQSSSGAYVCSSSSMSMWVVSRGIALALTMM